MAVKEKTQTQSASASGASAPASAPDTNTGDTGNTGNAGNGSAGRGKAKNPRGPLDPTKRWAVTQEQRDARNLALVKVLKDPKLGTLKTPASVAEVLASLPEFEGVQMSPTMVKNRVDSIIRRRKKAGKEIGSHLVLGVVSRESDKDLEVFD